MSNFVKTFKIVVKNKEFPLFIGEFGTSEKIYKYFRRRSFKVQCIISNKPNQLSCPRKLPSENNSTKQIAHESNRQHL